MSIALSVSRLADDLAESDVVPSRSIVGILNDDAPGFAISPPLDNVLNEVLGFIAPDSWWGVAIVADVEVDGVPRRCVWVANRNGDLGATSCPARDEDEALAAFAGVLFGDLARRCLGIDTDPPTIPFATFAEGCWLDLLVTEAMVSRLTAKRVKALFPVPRRTQIKGDPWHRFHQTAIATSAAEGVSRFEWMDTGMFSRWVAGLWPEPAVLVDTLADLVEPSVMACVLERCPSIRAQLDGVATVSA